MTTNNGTDQSAASTATKPPFDNPGSAQGDGADARPQGLHRHPDRGAGQDRRRDAAAAGRAVGHAARRCCKPCPAMVPMSRRTAPRRARSWKSSATGRTSGSKSRSRRAMSRSFRDPAVILIDQLKEIYIDGDARNGRDRELARQGHTQGLYDRRSTTPAAASTTRISSSTRTTPAARRATTAAIATPNSTRSSTSSR